VRRGVHRPARLATQHVGNRSHHVGDSEFGNEISFGKPPWLRQPPVVNLMGTARVDNAKIERRIAGFPAESLAAINKGLARLLGLPS